ncbi:hypothetical protein Csa_015378 [Cucumis sativus]|uniref:Uncharacterized protein n=1 Tax=Cucumis sativus TaxID=3659 RepID=A0A0A0KXL8_CUCSA|nr:hypothetical protein Csa_015378 [Cucumis sativus]
MLPTSIALKTHDPSQISFLSTHFHVPPSLTRHPSNLRLTSLTFTSRLLLQPASSTVSTAFGSIGDGGRCWSNGFDYKVFVKMS